MEIPAKEEIWVGSASFDKKVKFNRKTKKFTHKISADVGSERDFIANIFKQHGFESTIIDNFQMSYMASVEKVIITILTEN
ncbi:LssY C-terminal domain-containing protein [Wolbachia endosymbiont of Chironomus riparius]|uniref:LssY C-terminal domain-containing protein n=1 Tax=Wolbachia endosymbiont of Chironomus riparius TaxID=2883238 RepID=UPI00209CC1BA|nr:LssY C-terminal domain-containing protein [Wolbachia endosymbiont of Chironomus riparius]